MSTSEGTTARSESASISPTWPEPELSIEALHLSITAGRQNIHLLEDGDLGVILHRGQDGRSLAPIPHDDLDGGLVVLALGVDKDHDEVHYTHRGAAQGIDAEELLGQAVETLQACRESLIRIRKANGPGERNAFEIGRDYERGQREAGQQ